MVAKLAKGKDVKAVPGFAQYHVNISVMSYRDAALYSSFEDIPATIFISIEDTGFPITPLDCDNINVFGILKLWFSDTDINDAYAMTADDAEKIVSFVKHYLPIRPEIAVHCAAGISRSAGVAAALGAWLNGDDSFVMDSPYRRPNMLCYKRVLDAADIEYDEAELAEKEAANRKLWDAWHDEAYIDAQCDVLDADADIDAETWLPQRDIERMDASWKEVFGEDTSRIPGNMNRVQSLMAIGLAHEDELEEADESWPM